MMTGFGMGLGGLVMGLFWIGLIAGVAWLVRGLFPVGQQPIALKTQSEPGTEDILKQRYARGEISTAQYDQMRRDLSA